MVMQHKNALKVLAAATAAGLAVSTMALPTYTVDALGDVDGGDFFSRSFDINEHGMIVGASKDTDVFFEQIAVRWPAGSNVPQILTGIEAQEFSRAQTANNDGLIGGYADNLGEGQQAWIWDADNGVDFIFGEDNPDFNFSRMGEVTDYGKVVGWYRKSGANDGTRGYVYDLDTEDVLELDPIGPDGNQSLARSMNMHGLVVGSASAEPDVEKPIRVAVAWGPGATTPNVLPGLGEFDDYEETQANFATDSGKILGQAGNRNDDNTLFAQNELWCWDPSTQTAESLGFLPGYDWIRGGGTNSDVSMVVGWAHQDGEEGSEFIENHVGAIWTASTGWVDVNTLIEDAPDGYYIAELNGVNEYGVIVGTAVNNDGNIEAVRLSPACLSLTVDNFVAGERALFTLSRGTPGQRGVVLYGFGGDPSTFIDVKDWCATFDFDVRIQGKTIQVAATGIFDNNGVIEAVRPVKETLGGTRVLFQGAERGTCPEECMSNVVDIVAQ